MNTEIEVTPEKSIQLERVRLKNALDCVEMAFSDLLDPGLSSDHLCKVAFHAGRLRALLRASLRFPRISLGFLSLRDAEGLPRFAISDWGFASPRQSEWTPQYGYQVADGVNLAARNLRDERVRESSFDGWRVHALPPPVPDGAAEQVKRCGIEFDRTYLVWEADWLEGPASGGKDPLVIGVVLEAPFLIAKWDQTKIEDYVAHEFTEEVK